MDFIWSLLLMVGANVLSQLIIDWLKDIHKNDDEEHDKNDER